MPKFVQQLQNGVIDGATLKGSSPPLPRLKDQQLSPDENASNKKEEEMRLVENLKEKIEELRASQNRI